MLRIEKEGNLITENGLIGTSNTTILLLSQNNYIKIFHYYKFTYYIHATELIHLLIALRA